MVRKLHLKKHLAFDTPNWSCIFSQYARDEYIFLKNLCCDHNITIRSRAHPMPFCESITVGPHYVRTSYESLMNSGVRVVLAMDTEAKNDSAMEDLEIHMRSWICRLHSNFFREEIYIQHLSSEKEISIKMRCIQGIKGHALIAIDDCHEYIQCAGSSTFIIVNTRSVIK